MPTIPKISPAVIYAVTIAVIILGFVFWISDLTSDPPMYFSGSGQSLGTDPPQYVYHARSDALFNDFTPFDYSRWTVFQHSLTSGLALVVFSLAGVSIYSANLVGVLLSLGGLALLLLGLARHHRPWVLPVVSVSYLSSLTLITYGRLSYLENGLIFLSGAIVLIYCRWGDRPWGVFLSGMLVAAAALTGKLFGLLFLPILLAAYFLASDNWKRDAAILLAGFATSFVALVLLLHGADFGASLGYVGEQSYGLYGFPEGLSSPWGFFEKLISYNFRNRLYFLDPEAFYSLIIGGLLLVNLLGRRLPIRSFSPSTLVIMLWTIIGILGLFSLNYSPIRYTLFFLPALVALLYVVADDFLRVQLRDLPRFSGNTVTWAVAIYISWVVVFQVFSTIFYFNVMVFPTRIITWSTLLPGIGVAWLMHRAFAAKRIRMPHWGMTAVLSFGVAIAIGLGGFRIYKHHIAEQNYNIVEANADLAAILGPDAVVSGPYGPMLTMETPLRSFIHMFGVAQVDSTLFDRYPVTHLACDASNWELAVKDYPQIRDVHSVASYWIRNFEVKVYDISKSFNNPTAHTYLPTDHEKAVMFLHRQQLDSAFFYANRFYVSHRDSESGGYLIADLLFRAQRVQDSHQVLKHIADNHPTDFYAQIAYGRLLQIMAHQNRDRVMLDAANRYFAKAVEVNPYAGEFATTIWEDTRRRAEAAAQNAPSPVQKAP